MVLRRGWVRSPKTEDAFLVLEVSDVSLRKGKATKAALYVRRGIPEYVILDVTGRWVEIRRRPNPKKETWDETLILGEVGEAWAPQR